MRQKLTKVLTKKTKRNTSHATAGITLTEVVVASGLLVAAIVPILKALTTAYTTSRIIERRTHSLMLAQGELDRIKANSIYNYDESFAQSSSLLDDAYLCTVTDNADSPNLRTIRVSVGCDLDNDGDLASNEIEVTLTTCLARRWPGP